MWIYNDLFLHCRWCIKSKSWLVYLQWSFSKFCYFNLECFLCGYSRCQCYNIICSSKLLISKFNYNYHDNSMLNDLLYSKFNFKYFNFSQCFTKFCTVIHSVFSCFSELWINNLCSYSFTQFCNYWLNSINNKCCDHRFYYYWILSSKSGWNSCFLPNYLTIHSIYNNNWGMHSYYCGILNINVVNI